MFHSFPSPPVAFIGRVVRRPSSVVRLVGPIDPSARWSKPDDPRLDSLNHDSSFREGHPEKLAHSSGSIPSHPIPSSRARSRGWISPTFTPVDRRMRARGSIHRRDRFNRSSAVSFLRGVKPSFVERVASRECAHARLDGSVGFARMDGWMDGSRGEYGSRVRRVMDFGFDFFITDE